MHRIYTPPPLKLNHRYATEVDFEIYEMWPLTDYTAHDFFIPNPSPIRGHIYVLITNVNTYILVKIYPLCYKYVSK